MGQSLATLLIALSCAWAATLAATPAHQHAPPQILAPGYTALAFTPPAPGSYSLPPLRDAGDGALLDSDGKALQLHELLGDRVVVLSFIYTRCSDVNGCPLAGYVLKQLQDRLLATPELADKVRLLSISFDPDYDTPAVLDKYAQHLRRDASDWRFLTAATQAGITPLLAAYDQWVVRDYDADGKAIGSMSHLLRVYLIDRHKRIRNIYSVSFLHADTVAADIETLLLEENH